MSEHAQELAEGKRFAFGANWARFLRGITDERLTAAEDSLRRSFAVESFAGSSFLDAGCGSGIFSLAARRLGARVRSFDYDPASVECTRRVREQYRAGDPDWQIEEGSVLDPAYLGSLGRYDVVYSWGVLHHTGNMWRAMENVASLVKPGGVLFVAIYNDQGRASRRWLAVKRAYNALPRFLHLPFALLIIVPWEAARLAAATVRLRPWVYFSRIRHYGTQGARGMSYWRDLMDWIGGYPFEVATPGAVFDFYRDRGFSLRWLRTQGGNLGCNEFGFVAPLG